MCDVRALSSSQHQALRLSGRIAEHRGRGALRRSARRDTVCLRSGVSSYENGLAASGETPGRGRAHDTGTAGRYTRSRRRLDGIIINDYRLCTLCVRARARAPNRMKLEKEQR